MAVVEPFLDAAESAKEDPKTEEEIEEIVIEWFRTFLLSLLLDSAKLLSKAVLNSLRPLHCLKHDLKR